MNPESTETSVWSWKVSVSVSMSHKLVCDQSKALVMMCTERLINLKFRGVALTSRDHGSLKLELQIKDHIISFLSNIIHWNFYFYAFIITSQFDLCFIFKVWGCYHRHLCNVQGATKCTPTSLFWPLSRSHQHYIQIKNQFTVDNLGVFHPFHLWK